jgi:hypothetical protein
LIGANRAHLGDRPLLDAMSKVRDELATPPSADELLLLGRRQFRTNNNAHPGVSANDWTDSTVVESVVGQSVLNGVPVRLRPLATAAADLK